MLYLPVDAYDVMTNIKYYNNKVFIYRMYVHRQAFIYGINEANNQELNIHIYITIYEA